jgi:WD40 repeat protein
MKKFILSLFLILTIFAVLNLKVFAVNSPHAVVNEYSWSIAFSPDGKILAIGGGSSHTVSLLDLSTNQIIVSLHPKNDHRKDGDVVDMLFSPDGKTLASRQEASDIIELWNVDTGTHKTTLWDGDRFSGKRIVEMLFSPDGKTLAVAYWSPYSTIAYNVIQLWDTSTDAVKATLEGHTGKIKSISYSPNGQMLASGGKDNTIRLWDTSTGALKATLEWYASDNYAYFIKSVVFSPDGRTLAGRGHNSTVHLWDVATSTLKATVKGRPNTDVTFSPDGRTLATRMDGSIHLWDVATGAHRTTLEINYDLPTNISFSPDSSMLATEVGWGDKVYLYDIATGGFNTILNTQSRGVHTMLFSPNGSTLAAATESSIRFWDTSTQVSFTPFPVVLPAIGEQFSINVSINGGKNVGGYQFTAEFNPEVLEYVESANGDYLPPGAFFVPPDVLWEFPTFGATSLSGTANGDGTLATLTFKVLDIKESTLILSEGILTDSDGEVLPHILGYGLLTDPQVGPEDVNSDGIVNILDLVKVASRFNTSSEKEDINGDGVVNIIDLVKVAAALGAGAAAPSLHPQALAMFTAANVQKWLAQAQGLNLTDATSQRGIHFLEQLLAALIPKETALLANYPNPFNPETWIPYQLAESADVMLRIYAVDGKLVRMLELGHQAVGIYQGKSRAAYWDGRNAVGEPVASGIYFYTLTAGDFTATRKMLIRK